MHLTFSTIGKLFLLCSSLFFLCSFSSTPVEKKPRLSKQEQRLQKKKKRLQARLDHYNTITKPHTKRKKRIQKRLDKLEEKPTTLYAAIAMASGIVAFLLAPSTFILGIVAAFGGAPSSVYYTIIAAFLLAVLLGGLALFLGFIYLTRSKKDPETYPKQGKAAAIVGIILGGIGLAIALPFFIYFLTISLSTLVMLIFATITGLGGLSLLIWGMISLKKNKKDPNKALDTKRETAIVAIVLGVLLLILSIVIFSLFAIIFL